MPWFLPCGVDAGFSAGLKALQTSPHNRLGAVNDAGPANDPRAVTTRQLLIEHRHVGEFRVPGLRQLVHTAPYMHDGSRPTLAAVVHHYCELDEERLHGDGESILRSQRLSAAQAAELEAQLAQPGHRAAALSAITRELSYCADRSPPVRRIGGLKLVQRVRVTFARCGGASGFRPRARARASTIR